MQDQLKLRGRVRLTLTRQDGSTEVQEINNLVVQVGRNYVANALIANATSPLTNMAIGTGTTSPANGDTALVTEVARNTFDSATATGGVVQISATFPAGTGTGAITEAGLFNAASDGSMFARATFSAYNKGAGDALTVNWEIDC